MDTEHVFAFSMNSCNVCLFDSKAKGGKAEIPSMLRTLPPHKTSQTQDEKPPGHNRAPGQQSNPGLEGEQRNKGDKEGHKSKQAETSSKVSTYDCDGCRLTFLGSNPIRAYLGVYPIEQSGTHF